MTTQEHLNKIKEKCEELLAIAAKRTPGKWTAEHFDKTKEHWCVQMESGGTLVWMDRSNDGSIDYRNRTDGDATFIASCAGPAEAGWRATIAAIDELEAIHEATPLGEYAAWDALNEIIAAWPEEIL